MDRRFFITLAAVRRQLAAMPTDYYLLRLIHPHTRAPFPLQPHWTAVQLARGGMVRFLRQRNEEGFDIYLRPYANQHNAGYLLLDLDAAGPHLLATLRAAGHEPCVVLQTSPGHLQAWIQVSETPLEPALASSLGRHLARAYGGDLASTDWCHLGRLAGFTNQKPQRRLPNGAAPWVRLLHARSQLATHGPALVQAMQHQPPAELLLTRPHSSTATPTQPRPAAITPATAAIVYQRYLNRLRIPQRFPQPDWSIADLWIATELLRCRVRAPLVQAILRLGSPGFPRCHGCPEDYLGRTLRRAVGRAGATRPAPGVDSDPPFPS